MHFCFGPVSQRHGGVGKLREGDGGGSIIYGVYDMLKTLNSLVSCRLTGLPGEQRWPKREGVLAKDKEGMDCQFLIPNPKGGRVKSVELRSC